MPDGAEGGKEAAERAGRPRSERAHQAILTAARELLIEEGFASLRLERGDLRPDADPGVATELLVGPVYFRLMFGGVLDVDFAEQIVDTVLRGFAA